MWAHRLQAGLKGKSDLAAENPVRPGPFPRAAPAIPAAAIVLVAALSGMPAQAQGQPLPGQPLHHAETGSGPRPNRGVAILMDQANYWTAQGRPELAQQALDRLLQVEPGNPDVLAAATEVAAQNGDRAIAEAYVGRVIQIAPNSPAALRASLALRAVTVDQNVLREARRLAQAGQRPAAMQRYNELFPNGEVPTIFAAEYYQTLAGTSEEGFEAARQGLERLLANAPENRPLQFAHAQMLTYNELYRSDGIQRLKQLADAPGIGAAARAAWRQALLWQGTDSDTVAGIESYLASNRTDPEIDAKLAEARAAVVPSWVIDRITAWQSLSERQITAAENGFNSALAGDPADAEAVSGLAVIRKIQNRLPEARTLLARAIELSPDRKQEFEERLGDLSGHVAPARAGAGGRGPAAPVPRSVLAWQALNRGKLDHAAGYARQAAGGAGAEKVQGETVLGILALRGRDFPAAEARFRAALAVDPRFREAQGGLFEALQRQRRFAEADRFALDTGFRPSADSLRMRSAALRDEAQTGDADARIALLRGAVAADPGNVWASFDLARLLKNRGQQEEGRRIEASLAARNTADSLFAAGLLANADGRMADSLRWLGSIAPPDRPEEARRILRQNEVLLQLRGLERAARGDARSEAARGMLALAAEPDPSGQTQAAVIRAFGRLRQPGNVDAAARAAEASMLTAPPAARVLLASALLEAGRVNDAEALAARAEGDPRLGAEARRLASTVRNNSAVAAADRLAETGDRQAALARLSPALSRAPEDAQVQLSLARIHANSGRADEASQIAEAVLRREPDNVAARSVAAEAAVARGAYRRAEELLAEGRTRRAEELQMSLVEARIARAKGDQLRARRALETAARLRAEQLTAVDPAGDSLRR